MGGLLQSICSSLCRVFPCGERPGAACSDCASPEEAHTKCRAAHLSQ